MIKSKFISDILDLLLDGDADGIAARPQIQFLTDDEYEYTGGGLFVNFSSDQEIVQHKVGKDNLILNGVKITTTEFPIEADATVFFKDGIVNYLEIWCYLGDYPNKDLAKYNLVQAWRYSPGKQISTETHDV